MNKWLTPFLLLALLSLLGAGMAAAQGAGGKALYAQKCAGCHGPDGTKAAAGVSKPLKGMKAADVEKELQGYKDGTFGGQKKAMMIMSVKNLSPEDMKALAEYVSTL